MNHTRLFNRGTIALRARIYGGTFDNGIIGRVENFENKGEFNIKVIMRKKIS